MIRFPGVAPRRALSLCLLLSGCTLPWQSRPAPTPAQAAAAPQVAPADARVEVLWDSWGVPHIYGQDDAAAMFAYGWAQMRSHGDLLLRLYGQARGRAAEYWGEAYVESDTWLRTNRVPERAVEWLGQQHAHERALLDAFAAGINAYGQQHGDSVDAALRQVLPVSAVDVLAHVQRVVHFTFMTSPGEVIGVQRALDRSGAGSNAWAIGPRRSASRRALLLANPHLPWDDLFTLYESHLVTPELNAYGVSVVGFPVHAIAFNDSLGWALTVNPLDGADHYRLTLRGDGYLMDGELRAFESEPQTLRVRAADGTLAERAITIRRSVHGPVVAQTAQEAVALRVAGLDAPNLIAQFYDMARARNVERFQAVLARQQLPMFNVIYADARGHILYVFNGRLPVRATGDAAYWRGLVPGDTSLTLWQEVEPYWRMPRLLDPATGWLQNANDPPWTATIPIALDPRRFPTSLPAPGMSFRAQRSARMLAEDASITFDELVAYKHSSRLEVADHMLEDLIYAARASGSAAAREAADVLERWDREATAESPGAVLFEAFYHLLRRQPYPGGSPFAVPWSVRAPLATPDGLADPRGAVRVLEQAAADVRARHGALDVAWGDVHRLRRDTLDLPASGGPAALGSFRVLDFEDAADGRRVATAGDSWVAAIEFAEPIRARAVLGYGNASRVGSPHRTDQLPLVARQELRDVFFARADVEANTVAREWF